jgi:hypothetical protein
MKPSTWNEWLAAEDSESVLAPKGYDEHAARLRVKDSTALVDYRVSAKGDSGPFAPALAWIVLSHFGMLATVVDCQDSDLLARIARLLENLGLQYIPYDYAANKIY